MIKYTSARFLDRTAVTQVPGRYFGLLTAAVCLAMAPSLARADVALTLNNASFETQNPFDQTAGCGSATPCYNFSIVDWDQHNPSGESGTFDPTLGVPPIAPPALVGNNVAFMNSNASGGSYITQDLGNLIAGDTYTISVEVSSRGPMGATPQALYRLGAATGGTSAAPTFASFIQIAGVAPANPTSTSDNWALATLDFTPTTSGDWYTYVSDDGAITGGNAQLEVDAVPSVPEPAAVLLLFSIVACLAITRRKSAARA